MVRQKTISAALLGVALVLTIGGGTYMLLELMRLDYRPPHSSSIMISVIAMTVGLGLFLIWMIRSNRVNGIRWSWRHMQFQKC